MVQAGAHEEVQAGGPPPPAVRCTWSRRVRMYANFKLARRYITPVVLYPTATASTSSPGSLATLFIWGEERRSQWGARGAPPRPRYPRLTISTALSLYTILWARTSSLFFFFFSGFLIPSPGVNLGLGQHSFLGSRMVARHLWERRKDPKLPRILPPSHTTTETLRRNWTRRRVSVLRSMPRRQPRIHLGCCTYSTHEVACPPPRWWCSWRGVSALSRCFGVHHVKASDLHLPAVVTGGRSAMVPIPSLDSR